jgi:hypothetical protein
MVSRPEGRQLRGSAVSPGPPRHVTAYGRPPRTRGTAARGSTVNWWARLRQIAGAARRPVHASRVQHQVGVLVHGWVSRPLTPSRCNSGQHARKVIAIVLITGGTSLPAGKDRTTARAGHHDLRRPAWLLDRTYAAWLQLWLQLASFAPVHRRPPSRESARQPAYRTAANRHERDHDGLAVWGSGVRVPSAPPR